MRAQAISYISEELTTVEALLSRAQGQTDTIKKDIAGIEKISLKSE